MNKYKNYPWYFVLGALMLYSIFCLLPGFLGIIYSFTDWNSFTKEVNFVGFENYISIFTDDREYGRLIGNTIMFTVVTTTLKTVLGCALGLLFTHAFVKATKIHRMIIFLPQVMSFLVVGLVFKSLLHPSTGFVNNFLTNIGLDFLAQNWLTDLKLAFPTVMAVDIWKGVGYNMVIFIAGLTSISATYYEAADIDGASFWHKFRYITLPLLKPILVNATVLNITYGLRVFDVIYSLTNGGPGRNTTAVINIAIYKTYSKGNYAMSTTLSSVLFFIMLCILYFVIKAMENQGVSE